MECSGTEARTGPVASQGREVASRKKGQFEAEENQQKPGGSDTAGFSVFGGKQFSPVQVEKSSGWKQVAQGLMVSGI